MDNAKVKVFAGRYAYVKPLGRGAGGSVYLAEDLRAKRRQVALKVLTPEAYGTVQGKMLRREFEILSKLDHANLVRVYDYGRLPDGGVFLAEEYIDGFSLQDARALLDPAALIGLTLQILDGLAYLHGMGMIHRDIKPANVMLLWLDDASTEPMVKLVDFGLSSMDPKRDTLRGGTRSYMAPEIIRGEKGEPRSDMFSLGVTLYYALCGVLPFGPRTKDDPPPTDEKFRPPEPHRLNPEVPLTLSRFTMALLRQLPDVAYTDAGEAMQALARDVQDTSSLVAGRFANSLDTSAPQILRGYFERGIMRQQSRDHDYLVRHLTEGEKNALGAFYLIAGEAATGKSRLMREVETACKLSGRMVLSVACAPEQSTPWGLMAEIVHQILVQAKQHKYEEAERFREHLLILNELVTARSQTLLIERQEAWMGEAWEVFSQLLARDRPVLFIEDLHAADDASVEFLAKQFANDEALARIAVVATCLPDSRLEPFADLQSVHAVLSEGVTLDDIEQLFHERMQLDDVSIEWLEALSERANGMPDYVLEVCRALVDQGAIWRENASRWSLDAVQLEMFSLPSGLRESFRRRLNYIGASGRELLELLALMERPVEWSFLRTLAVAGGEEGKSVDRAIETLRFRHLIRVDLEMSGRHVSLIHRDVKGIMELLISPEWRRALHRRIGRCLEKQWRSRGGDADEVAHHHKEGGEEDLAAIMAWTSGQVSLGKGDWKGAKSALELATGHKHSAPDHVLLLIEQAHVALAMFEPAACMSALTQATQQAEENALHWLMFHAFMSACEATSSLGRFKESEAYLANLQDILPVMVQQPRYLEARARLAFASGDIKSAQASLKMSRARHEHFGNPAGVLSTVSAAAMISGMCEDASTAGALLQEAYDLAREHGLRDRLGEALLIHAHLMRLGNEPERALRLLNDALEAMSGEGLHTALWIDILLEFSCTYEAMGRVVEAEQRAIEALLLARRLEHAAGDAFATILISDFATRRSTVAGEAHLSRMQAAWEQLQAQPYYRPWVARAAARYGRALARMGDEARGLELLDASERTTREFMA